MELDLGTFSVRTFRPADVASLTLAANHLQIAAHLHRQAVVKADRVMDMQVYGILEES